MYVVRYESQTKTYPRYAFFVSNSLFGVEVSDIGGAFMFEWDFIAELIRVNYPRAKEDSWAKPKVIDLNDMSVHEVDPNL